MKTSFCGRSTFCMLLPGPEAQQLATYIGWRLHGTWGGIAAGSLFVIPSIFVMLLLSYLAVAHIDIPAVAAAFYGIQPVVVAVVVEAVLRIGKKALKHKLLYGFAALAFVAIFVFKVPFPYIVAAAALGGLLMQRPMPQVFCKGRFDAQTRECRIEAESSTKNKTVPGRLFPCGKGFHGLPGLVGDPVGVYGLAWGRRHPDPDRPVFHQGRLCHLRRRLRRAQLYHRCGRIQRLALYPADVDRSGTGRVHPRPADHGDPIRRFPGGLEPARRTDPLTAAILGALLTTYVTFPALLFLHLRRRALHRGHGRQPAAAGRADRRHRCGGGRGAQSGGLVRTQGCSAQRWVGHLRGGLGGRIPGAAAEISLSHPLSGAHRGRGGSDLETFYLKKSNRRKTMTHAIDIKELKKLFENEEPMTLLDVRRKADYQANPNTIKARYGAIPKRSTIGSSNCRLESARWCIASRVDRSASP
jgi:chromate transport protein ChrA